VREAEGKDEFRRFALSEVEMMKDEKRRYNFGR
jgi:hypothetical protein